MRAITTVLVQEEEHLSLTGLSKRLNRDLAALSRAAGRILTRFCSKPDGDSASFSGLMGTNRDNFCMKSAFF